MTQSEPQQPNAPASNVESAELSLSTTFELLKNRRRRETIAYLIEHDGNSTLSDLAEHIAALENGIEVIELSSDQRKRVYIGLYQCHLPKLDKAGVVDFDKNRGTVVLKESVADQLVPYLQPEGAASTQPTMPSAPASPSEAPSELGITALVSGVVGLVALLALVPVLGGGFVGAATAGLVLGIGLVAAVHAFRDRVDVSALLSNPDGQAE